VPKVDDAAVEENLPFLYLFLLDTYYTITPGFI
jgi:hypothetical protein